MSNSQTSKFIDKFNNNASAVLKTITNENVDINIQSINPFAYDVISQTVNIPLVLLSLDFSGDQNFQTNIIFSSKLVAILADLMMLGDGTAEYIAEEHNDAVQEMFNQILGSLNAELAGDGTTITGKVTSVELTDMDIQRDFLQDNSMITINISILDENHTSFIILDNSAQDCIKKIIPEENISQNTDSKSDINKENNSNKQNILSEKPVNVSHAEFSNINYNNNEKEYSNINIDLLFDVDLPITVELGRKNMKIKEILDLGQGSVVELDKVAGDFVDILVNGKRFAVGEVMVVEENFAIRIVNLISKEDRIKSLGKNG